MLQRRSDLEQETDVGRTVLTQHQVAGDAVHVIASELTVDIGVEASHGEAMVQPAHGHLNPQGRRRYSVQSSRPH